MKKYILFILLFTLMPWALSANITFRKPTHQSRKHNVSYLTIDTKTEKSGQQHIQGSSSNYYHSYAPNQTSSQSVAYNHHSTMKAHSSHDLQPFEETTTVGIGKQQNAYGPPVEGPISDVILPLLLLAGGYVIFLKSKK